VSYSTQEDGDLVTQYPTPSAVSVSKCWKNCVTWNSFFQISVGKVYWAVGWMIRVSLLEGVACFSPHFYALNCHRGICFLVSSEYWQPFSWLWGGGGGSAGGAWGTAAISTAVTNVHGAAPPLYTCLHGMYLIKYRDNFYISFCLSYWHLSLCRYINPNNWFGGPKHRSWSLWKNNGHLEAYCSDRSIHTRH
jgi:hypothetical protein